MAIRLELPPTVFPGLRSWWRRTSLEAERSVRLARAWSARMSRSSAEARRRAAEWLFAMFRLRARAAADCRASIAEFEERFEDLTDLLCWAAKDGVHTGRDARHAEVRAWMLTCYPRIEAALRPFWEAASPVGACDPFLALFGPLSIDDVINSAESIELIMRSREAIEAYHATRD